jgi:hypothetical protein
MLDIDWGSIYSKEVSRMTDAPTGGHIPTSSRLVDHVKEGRGRWRPPLRALSNLEVVNWLRDQFPDMLWLCSIIHLQGEQEGSDLAMTIVRTIQELAGRSSTGMIGAITGALSSLERVPEEFRAKIRSSLLASGLLSLAVPPIVAATLYLYEDFPGSWLFSPDQNGTSSVSIDEIEDFLNSLIANCFSGRSTVPTIAKSVVVRALVECDALRAMPNVSGWLEGVEDYPTRLSSDDRSRLDSTIRAAFLNAVHLVDKSPDESDHPTPEWPSRFWRQNWSKFDCWLEPPGPAQQSSDDESGEQWAPNSDEPNDSWQEDARTRWIDRVNDAAQRFTVAVYASDPDLYVPTRHEVLTGIVYRHIRAACVAIDSPILWTGEHGSNFIRSLIESLIVVKWLIKNDSIEWYERFKEYGRGHLKLAKLHMEDYATNLPDEYQAIWTKLEDLDALVNRDMSEEMQDILIQSTFNGVPLYKMAEDTDSLNDYRLTFAVTSSSLHGEWSFLDREVLVPCANLTHRFHRIPNADYVPTYNRTSMDLFLNRLDELVDIYIGAIEQS